MLPTLNVHSRCTCARVCFGGGSGSPCVCASRRLVFGFRTCFNLESRMDIQSGRGCRAGGSAPTCGRGKMGAAGWLFALFLYPCGDGVHVPSLFTCRRSRMSLVPVSSRLACLFVAFSRFLLSILVDLPPILLMAVVVPGCLFAQCKWHLAPTRLSSILSLLASCVVSSLFSLFFFPFLFRFTPSPFPLTPNLSFPLLPPPPLSLLSPLSLRFRSCFLPFLPLPPF